MSATLHTTLGDIKVELYCDLTPRTSHNFLGLAAAGYYDGTKFHRNIKGFMIQASMPLVSVVLSTSSGGDPTGTGKGGESIWGGSFSDEFHPDATHDCRGILAMANKGANTNRYVNRGGHLMGGCVAPDSFASRSTITQPATIVLLRVTPLYVCVY
eukprot:17253-Heterococcus_DN1.PRE.1